MTAPTEAVAAPLRGDVPAVWPTAKRLFDIVATFLALLSLWPLIALVALAVRLTSPGPAFFVQTRIGRDGTRFGMVKFRSMYADAEARRAALEAASDRDGLCFKMKDDPRVTPLGRFLRRSSLDELPQLFNRKRRPGSVCGCRADRRRSNGYRGNHNRRRTIWRVRAVPKDC